jgi:hypothetical protein
MSCDYSFLTLGQQSTTICLCCLGGLLRFYIFSFFRIFSKLILDIFTLSLSFYRSIFSKTLWNCFPCCKTVKKTFGKNFLKVFFLKENMYTYQIPHKNHGSVNGGGVCYETRFTKTQCCASYLSFFI